MGEKRIVISLTEQEASSLSEAVRYLQQEHTDNNGKLDPTLSRIQRKLGEEPHD